MKSHHRTGRKMTLAKLIPALFKKTTPTYIKGMIIFALTYTVMPLDVLPDFLGIVGYIDDGVIIAGLIGLTMALLDYHSQNQVTAKAPGHSPELIDSDDNEVR